MKLQRLWSTLVFVSLLFLDGPLAASAIAQSKISDAIPGSRVQFALGAIDVYDSATTATEGRIEWRGVFPFAALSPLAGVMATGDGGVYGFAGLYLDFEFFQRIVITPSAAVGWYDEGRVRNLGHSLEFRAQIEVACTLEGDARLGLVFGHMSNGGLSDNNTGGESILLSYSLPLSSLRHQ